MSDENQETLIEGNDNHQILETPPDVNYHLMILQRYKQKVEKEKEEEKLQASQNEVQTKILEGESNPHAAIIARHMARKAEKDREEKEKEVHELKRRETIKKKEEEESKKKELAEKRAELLSTTIDSKIGIMVYLEGTKSYRDRVCCMEDKEPLTLKTYKQTIIEANLAEVVPITYDTNVEKCNLSRSLSTLTVSSTSKQKNDYFLISISNKTGSWKFGFNTETDREEWIEFMGMLKEKYYSAVESIVPETSHVNTTPKSTIKKNVTISFGLDTTSSNNNNTSNSDKKKKRSKSSEFQFEEAVINPFEDDVIGTSFKNPLFEK